MISKSVHYAAHCDGCKNDFEMAPSTVGVLSSALRGAGWRVVDGVRLACPSCLKLLIALGFSADETLPTLSSTLEAVSGAGQQQPPN